MQNDYQALTNIASQVRRDIVRMVHNAGNGHPGGALGCTELLVLLYFDIMQHQKDFTMNGDNEDLFFLSNGHISAVWYSVLARSGYFPVEELATHRKINSRLQGHPTTHEKLPGVRIASGSLGQGLSVAIGAALTKKINEDSRWVYVLMGDGEQQEGQIWEAAIFAAHRQVDNLIAFIDLNEQQIDGGTEQVMANRDLSAKYEAFGWEVFACDGNDLEALKTIIEQAQQGQNNGKPKMILMQTVMGQGVDFMMTGHHWHGKAPNAEQANEALAQLKETLGDF
ncbi:MAG TPA: transketolase [Microscillaceae bacterium]|nr:transketolase [Microscillaceae bacterium]